MKEIQPVYHLPVRGDQIVETAQGKTQRDSQLPRRLERACQWPPYTQANKIVTSTSCQIQKFKEDRDQVVIA